VVVVVDGLLLSLSLCFTISFWDSKNRKEMRERERGMKTEI
jgi:hypothetical protein